MHRTDGSNSCVSMIFSVARFRPGRRRTMGDEPFRAPHERARSPIFSLSSFIPARDSSGNPVYNRSHMKNNDERNPGVSVAGEKSQCRSSGWILQSVEISNTNILVTNSSAPLAILRLQIRFCGSGNRRLIKCHAVSIRLCKGRSRCGLRLST